MRNKSFHIREFVVDNFIEKFCMSQTWLYDSDSLIISVLTPKSHVLLHVPRPNKNGGGVWLPH